MPTPIRNSTSEPAANRCGIGYSQARSFQISRPQMAASTAEPSSKCICQSGTGLNRNRRGHRNPCRQRSRTPDDARKYTKDVLHHGAFEIGPGL